MELAHHAPTALYLVLLDQVGQTETICGGAFWYRLASSEASATFTIDTTPPNAIGPGPEFCWGSYFKDKPNIDKISSVECWSYFSLLFLQPEAKAGSNFDGLRLLFDFAEMNLPGGGFWQNKENFLLPLMSFLLRNSGVFARNSTGAARESGVGIDASI